MSNILHSLHPFPPAAIHRSVWLHFHFPLSFRHLEDLPAKRRINVNYETIRRWVLKFGLAIAANVRSRRVLLWGTWHFDEVFVRISGRRTYLWRAKDDEGEVLEVLALSRRIKPVALKLTRKLLKSRIHSV